jgi:hypothetical protein
MHTARILIAGTALAGSLVLAVPAAHAATADVWDQSGASSSQTWSGNDADHGDSGSSSSPSSSSSSDSTSSDSGWSGGASGSKEKEDSYGKEKEESYGKEKEESYGKEKEGSYGKEKEESYGKEKQESYGKESYGKESYGKEKEHSYEGGWKPHGGIHTGGGGMATGQSGDALAVGTALLLGGLGAGSYALRRRRGGSVRMTGVA